LSYYPDSSHLQLHAAKPLPRRSAPSEFKVETPVWLVRAAGGPEIDCAVKNGQRASKTPKA
jgi:hypothetical protein